MRLIDADNVLKALGVFNDREHGDPHFLNGIETAREIVEQAPTIDAEPVRRGVWVPIDDEPHEDFECSACGYVSTAAFDCGGITPNAFPYCPMCGAKMDGDGDAR